MKQPELHQEVRDANTSFNEKAYVTQTPPRISNEHETRVTKHAFIGGDYEEATS